MNKYRQMDGWMMEEESKVGLILSKEAKFEVCVVVVSFYNQSWRCCNQETNILEVIIIL